MMQDQITTRYIPVSKWNDYHLWPTAAGLRHLIFNAKRNGFHKVICRAGRRVLIDEQAFNLWMQEHKNGK